MYYHESYYPSEDKHLRRYAADVAGYIFRPHATSLGGSTHTILLAMSLYDAIRALHESKGEYPKTLVINNKGEQPKNKYGEPTPVTPDDSVPGNITITISLSATGSELLHVDYRIPVLGRFM